MSAEPSVMQRVRQKHARGCVIACLSMVTDIPYDKILSEFWGDRNVDGLGPHEYDTWLNQHGYAVIRRYRHYGPLHADKVNWPCEPFADRHIINIPSSSGAHALAMTRDGTVFDPNEDAPKRLSDLPHINYIAGIFKVCEPFPSEPLKGLHWTFGTGKCKWCGAESESYAYRDRCPGRHRLRTP